MQSIDMQLALTPHPTNPPRAIASVAAEMVDGGLRFSVGNADALVLPLPSAPVRTNGLWQTTCFELFVMPAAGPAYFEFNFSPSGAWAAYAFEGYRAGMRELTLLTAPTITRMGNEWLVDIDLSLLPPQPWRVGLTAVVEEQDGTKSYWALAHPPQKPDFHHRDCFALDLPPAA